MVLESEFCFPYIPVDTGYYDGSFQWHYCFCEKQVGLLYAIQQNLPAFTPTRTTMMKVKRFFSPSWFFLVDSHISSTSSRNYLVSSSEIVPRSVTSVSLSRRPFEWGLSVPSQPLSSLIAHYSIFSVVVKRRRNAIPIGSVPCVSGFWMLGWYDPAERRLYAPLFLTSEYFCSISFVVGVLNRYAYISLLWQRWRIFAANYSHQRTYVLWDTRRRKQPRYNQEDRGPLNWVGRDTAISLQSQSSGRTRLKQSCGDHLLRLSGFGVGIRKCGKMVVFRAPFPPTRTHKGYFVLSSSRYW